MIAVLTGDLVNSTKMSNVTYAEVINSLKGLLQEVNEKYQAIGEIYRGDEFQIQYPDPINALKSTLLIKLALHLSKFSPKPIQCTLSLAYGAYDIYDKKPNTSSGPVFIASGRALAKAQRGELSIRFQQKSYSDDIQLLNQFLNHLLNRLTKTQAALLYQYIASDFAEHKKIAEITGTTRQNISNRLSNIGAFLIRDYMAVINKKVMRFKENN
tara:strand:- start:7393 stop:8031 length:639 start_codon:yes stop_codon:yes gene_type:complete